nr:hypothetical protein [Bacillus mycoides]
MSYDEGGEGFYIGDEYKEEVDNEVLVDNGEEGEWDGVKRV